MITNVLPRFFNESQCRGCNNCAAVSKQAQMAWSCSKKKIKMIA